MKLRRTLVWDFPWNSVYMIDNDDIIKVNRIILLIVLLFGLYTKALTLDDILDCLENKPVICGNGVIITITTNKSKIFEEISQQTDSEPYLDLFYKTYPTLQSMQRKIYKLYDCKTI